ncbi:MAG: hypothetical protein ACI85O_003379 [Saprospiraceae bacterium]|jgi:uncharacterized protein YwgA
MKNALWIFAVLAITFLGDRAIGYVMQKQADDSQFRYARLYDNRAEADILLVGNSRGLIFYQPYIEKVTKSKTFNLSYNGMPIDLANVLVQDYFDLYPAPEKMVIDITMCDRLNDQLMSGFKMYSPYSDKLSKLLRDKSDTAYNGAQFSHLFRYNSEIYQRNLFYQNKTDEDWLLDRVISDNMVSGAETLEDYTIDFRPTQKINDKETDPEYVINQLVEMVKYAQAKGTEVELVINPYFPAFANKIVNITDLKKTVEAKTGLLVIDYSLAIRETAGFGDYQHLNKTGARAFIDKMLADNVLK